MGILQQEYWSGLPCPSPGDLPKPRLNPHLMSLALARGFFTTSASWEVHIQGEHCVKMKAEIKVMLL